MLIPVLKDSGRIESALGQLVIAGGSIADFAAIILLSLFFAGEGGPGATLVLIGALLALAAMVFVAVRGAQRSMRIRADLLRLQDTTAQIRVRGAMVLLIGFAAAAQKLGLEVILGTFAAGAILSLADPDRAMTHPDFRRKLEAIGFGVFIPVFFVTSGVRFDLGALAGSARDGARCSWPRCWSSAASRRCSTSGCSTGARRSWPACCRRRRCRSWSRRPRSAASSG